MPHAHPIVLVPGFLGGKLSLGPLRDELAGRGFPALVWPRAPWIYRGRLAAYGALLRDDVLKMRSKSDYPLTMFGWSWGGPVAIAAMRALAATYSNPHEIVRSVVTFGSPFGGTWAAHPGTLLDLLGFRIREMRRGHATLSALVRFLHEKRRWRFHAIHGSKDLLVRRGQHGLHPDWCRTDTFNHRAPLYDPRLFELIHTLVLTP